MDFKRWLEGRFKNTSLERMLIVFKKSLTAEQSKPLYPY
jgi:hypothetical protein